MVVLSVILGVLLMIGGFACIFTPLATFFTTGYFLCALMLVFGIVGIVRAFQKKADVFEIIVSILAIIVGLIALFRPGSSLVFDGVILIFIACWFLVEGIAMIVEGVKSRATNRHWWVNPLVGKSDRRYPRHHRWYYRFCQSDVYSHYCRHSAWSVLHPDRNHSDFFGICIRRRKLKYRQTLAISVID